jgi:hypothetical protein
MKWIAVLTLLVAGCSAPIQEIPFEPGVSHCVSKMSYAEQKQAMAWQSWKHQPMLAFCDMKGEPRNGESSGKHCPRLYCPPGKGMILIWDLNKAGTPPDYKDTEWTAHCYYVVVGRS